MEFSKEVKGTRPLVLDTSVVIDGRIADVAETRVIDQPLIVPRFVLQELQGIADSSDKLRRNRGRRGLDILNKLQKSTGVEVKIHDAEIPELAGIREVDQKLVVLAKHLGGRVVTNDYNLNKIARLQGVEVINLNDLANALKPIVLPGETLMVKILKRGEEPGQGVGYLDDGTMVVTEHGQQHLGEMVRLTVTSVLQTSAGRMIFGRIDHPASPAGARQQPRRHEPGRRPRAPTAGPTPDSRTLIPGRERSGDVGTGKVWLVGLALGGRRRRLAGPGRATRASWSSRSALLALARRRPVAEAAAPPARRPGAPARGRPTGPGRPTASSTSSPIAGVEATPTPPRPRWRRFVRLADEPAGRRRVARSAGRPRRCSGGSP